MNKPENCFFFFKYNYQIAVSDDERHLHDYSTAMWKETGNHHINIPSMFAE